MTYFHRPEEPSLMELIEAERLAGNPAYSGQRAIDLIERNAKCDQCGSKDVEVLSLEERKLKCRQCGWTNK